MRGLPASLTLAVLAVTALLAGCATNLPLPPPPQPQPESGPLLVTKDAPPDATPRVVRRLVAETQEQMEKDRAMVSELPDPRGRARAQEEADVLDHELRLLAARVDDADSDNLDDVMNRLQLLDTRIDLFHEKLRAATSHTTAVLKD